METDLARSLTNYSCSLQLSSSHHTTLNLIDDFQIVATQEISPGQVILVDRQTISTTSRHTSKNLCCSYCCVTLQFDSEVFTASDLRTFCSSHCLHSATRKIIQESPAQDEGETIDERLFPATSLLPQLLATYLECPLQSLYHPLMHPTVSRWKADFRNSVRFPICFEMYIKRPIAILEDLGVDPFADSRFDTWVLLNILNRIGSNLLSKEALPQIANFESYPTPPDSPKVTIRSFPSKNGEAKLANVLIHSLGYLLPLFNHSCTPNVDIEPNAGGTLIRANRLIKTGEELCVSYVQPETLKKDKNHALRPWFDHCRCETCNSVQSMEGLK